jgi:hypothetical protein
VNAKQQRGFANAAWANDGDALTATQLVLNLLKNVCTSKKLRCLPNGTWEKKWVVDERSVL